MESSNAGDVLDEDEAVADGESGRWRRDAEATPDAGGLSDGMADDGAYAAGQGHVAFGCGGGRYHAIDRGECTVFCGLGKLSH